MKKILTIALVAVSVLALGTTAFAVIAGSHHDLSGNTATANYKRTGGDPVSSCEFCHAPHHVQTTVENAPLWNRSIGNTTFTLYANGGATVSGTTITGLGANSLTCLSCHDGQQALGVMANGLTATMNIADIADGSPADIGDSGTYDLQNDHPVGFALAADGTAGVPNPLPAAFRTYGASDTFECASCHDPHDNVTGNVMPGDPSQRGGSQYFLRAPHGSICSDCHTTK